MTIKTDVSLGEFIDKLTILEIKSERIMDATKLANIKRELELLRRTWTELSYSDTDINEEFARLKSINEKLWETEDGIREKEAKDEFDAEFIDLARSVYLSNDERAEIKREINKKLGSDLIEEKSYSYYRRK